MKLWHAWLETDRLCSTEGYAYLNSRMFKFIEMLLSCTILSFEDILSCKSLLSLTYRSISSQDVWRCGISLFGWGNQRRKINEKNLIRLMSWFHSQMSNGRIWTPLEVHVRSPKRNKAQIFTAVLFIRVRHHIISQMNKRPLPFPLNIRVRPFVRNTFSLSIESVQWTTTCSYSLGIDPWI